MKTELSKEARVLLGNLLEYYSFRPDYMESQSRFQQRSSIWKDCETASQEAFNELENLVLFNESSTPEQHASYLQATNKQAKTLR